jgi:hypothetical protein
MRKIKELNSCIARLQGVQAGNDLRPEQQKEIKRAIEQLKQLSRFPHPSQTQVICVVREITEALLRMFLDK